jgi:hypothetical protein
MRRHTSLIGLVVLLLIGFGLRLYHLDAVAFRGDEAFSAQYWADQPLATTFSSIATLEPHPPLTYILFRLWGLLVGVRDVFTLRLLGVLPNMLGIAGMYALGKRLTGDKRVGVLAAALWAIHPYQIWHAQDFRNYAMWAGLSVLTLWTALRVIDSDRRRDWIIYCAVAIFTCYIFYMELITIGVLGLFVVMLFLISRNTHRFSGAHTSTPLQSHIVGWQASSPNVSFVLRWCIANAVIIGLVFAAYFITQGNLVGAGGYAGTTDSFEFAQYGYRFLPELNFGETLSLAFRQKIWIVLLIAFVVSWLIVVRHNCKQALFLALLAIVPLVMIGVVSTRLHIFRPRYIMMSSPAYVLLLSSATFIAYQWSKSKLKRRIVFGIMVGIVIGWITIAGISLRNYYFNPVYRKAYDWVEMTDYLRDNTQAGEVVIQTAVDSAYGFYYDASADDYALPQNPDQPEEEIIEWLAMWREEYSSLWVVARTLDWRNAGIVEAWVDENMQLVRDTATDGLPIRQYKQWEVAASEIADAPLTTFGDSINLMGARIHDPEPTSEVTIWLYWQPLSTTEEALTVFVHLIGAINPETGSPLWAQDDHPPQDGHVTTDLWQTNTVYRDVYELPLDGVPNSEYEVWVGFYNPVTGERLLTENGDDYYSIGTVIVD